MAGWTPALSYLFSRVYPHAYPFVRLDDGPLRNGTNRVLYYSFRKCIKRIACRYARIDAVKSRDASKISFSLSELNHSTSSRYPSEVRKSERGEAMFTTIVNKMIDDSGARRFSFLFLLVLVFSFGGCGAMDQGSPSNPSAALDAAQSMMGSAAEDFNRSLGTPTKGDLVEPADFSIGPQDLLEVALFNIEQTDGIPNRVQVRVSNNGMITLPLLNQVKVGGMTRVEAEGALKSAFGKYMHEPEIGITLVENRSNSIYVLGSVKSPGILPITGQETLRRVLAMAGGITQEAGMYVHVSRQISEKDQAYVISLSDLANDPTGKLNVAVRPGDFVNVPRAGSFFVDGYVERPNAYQLGQPYRLTQALAMAGGINNFASTEVTILRRVGGEVQTLTRDIDKIKSGAEEDLRIVENDLIMVPPNKAKVVFAILLSAVGYTSRSGSYQVSAGRVGGNVAGGGIGGVLLP
jgi:polysaccharide export outer membrane protein